MFQKAGKKSLNRSDHVWMEQRGGYKCCLCGAICVIPPDYPTPHDWMPNKYEQLTRDERDKAPLLAIKV